MTDSRLRAKHVHDLRSLLFTCMYYSLGYYNPEECIHAAPIIIFHTTIDCPNPTNVQREWHKNLAIFSMIGKVD